MGEKNRVKRDIFISYRREGGDDLARILYLELSMRGYSVFYDLETLENGKFNEALYWYIEQCTDFLLILPPNSLDRCQNEGDWVRQEIAHALKHHKNIVPVMLPGFVMPEDHALPEDIRECVKHNGVNCKDDKSTYTGMVDKIVNKFLDSKPSEAVTGLDGAPHILQKPDADCTIILKDHFRCPKCGAKRIHRQDKLDQHLVKIRPWIDAKTRRDIGLSLLVIIVFIVLMIWWTPKADIEAVVADFSTVSAFAPLFSFTFSDNLKLDLGMKLILPIFLLTCVWCVILNILDEYYRKHYYDELQEGPHTVQGVCENCNTKFLVVSLEKQREDWTPPEEEE